MAINFLTTAQRDSLVELYIAYFNRAPETNGLNYWTGQLIDKLNAGTSQNAAFSQIADSFYAAAIQYSDVTGYTQFMTSAEFVQKIYANVLGRTATNLPPTTAEVNYWVAAMEGPNAFATRGTLIQTMVASAKSYAGDATYGWVANLLANKVAVANYFALPENSGGLSGTAAVEAGVKALAAVTSSAASVIAAKAVIDAPVALDSAASGAEDTAISGQASATDLQGEAVTYSLSSGPAHGTVVFHADGSYVYTPNANYVGADSFTFSATDGSGSDSGVVTLTVTAVNDAPVAQAIVGAGNEDASILLVPVSVDPDAGDTATYSVNSQPSNGTVSLITTGANAGKFSYVPNANFHGTDSFTYKVTDGSGATSVATATVTIASVNDAPVAQAAAANVAEGAAVITGNVTATDIDSASLTFALNAAAPAGLTFNTDGTYSFDAANPAYNSLKAGATTTLTIGFTVSDGAGGTDNSKSLVITVTGTNDAPVAVAVVGSGAEDTVIAVTPSSSDVDSGDTATYSVNGQPDHGTVSFNAGTGKFEYTPNLNFHGTDSFTYKVTDGSGATSVATATVTVSAVNDAPKASDQTVNGFENLVVTGNVIGTDVDGDTLTYGASNATHGEVSMGADGSYTFTPDEDFNGVAGFDYTVNDNNGGTVTKHVTVNIADVVNILTPGLDTVILANPGVEVVLGTNNNLNAGDVITGGAEDTVVLSIDADLGHYDFAGFQINGVGTFHVTNDAPPTIFSFPFFSEGPVTFDLSSSNGIRTLVSENSTADLRFNYANTNADTDADGYDEVNLQVLNLTEGVNVTLDVRNDDVAGNDELNLLVTDSDDDGLDANEINVVASASANGGTEENNGIERVNLSTAGSTGEVRINDLNTFGTTQLFIDSDVDLTIGDTDNNLGGGYGFENALSRTVNYINATASTGNLAFSTEDNNSGNATILSGSGDDVIRTGDANNWVEGGAGNDLLITSGGNDTVYGQDGNDTIRANGGDNVLYGNDGDDSITSRDGNDYVEGGQGNDTINAREGNNTVYGQDGNDSITTGSGNDYIVGGVGNDTIEFGGGSDYVEAGEGDDVINAGSNLHSDYYQWYYPHSNDQVHGGAGNDTLNLTADSGDANELDGVDGVETINLTGGGSYSISVIDNSFFDIDTTTSTTINATTIGGTLYFNGNDGDIPGYNLSGYPSLDDGVLSRAITVKGGANNDTIITGLGADSIEGNAGNDSISSGAGNDTVWMGTGTDNVNLGAGTNILNVNGGDFDVTDTVNGNAGDDTARLINDGTNGGADNETAVLGAGVTGLERVVVIDSNDGIFNGNVTVTLDAGFAQSNITIDGSAMDSNEVLTVFANANSPIENVVIVGGAAADVFYMGDNLGSDSITGNGGNDTIVMDGTVVDGDFAGVTSVETLTMTSGFINGTVNGDSATLGLTAQGAGIVTVNGTDGGDLVNASTYTVGITVHGNSGNDTITSGAGNDTITGDDGDDLITSNNGADSVDGGAGNDTLVTGAGADTIIMGSGTDSVDAGTEADVIRAYNTQLDETDTISGGSGSDTVSLENQSGAVTAAVDLGKVTSVENFVLAGNGDRLIGVDADANTLSFTGGSVGTLTTINVNSSALTDPSDSFTVTLKAGQTDADFAFNYTGSSTTDVLVKQNTGVDNNINFQAGGGNDRALLNGSDLGSTTTINGGDGEDTIVLTGGAVTDDGFVYVSNVERLSGVNGSGLSPLVGAISVDGEVDSVSVSLNAGVTYTIDYEGAATAMGTLFDPLLRLVDINGVNVLASDDDAGAGFNSQIVFTPTVTGTYTLQLDSFNWGLSDTGTYTVTVSPAVANVALNAQLGASAANAGLQIIDGTSGNDVVLLDAAFTNNLTVNLGGGNDSFNATASSSTINFVANVADITAADTLSGGTGAADSMHLLANGVAAFDNVTRVESFFVTENGDSNATFNFVDGNFTGVIGNVITVNASALNDDGFGGDTEGGFTMNGSAAAAGHGFNVTGGTGADSIVTGAGNDVINGGADYTFGAAANDTVNAGAGDNSVTTHNGADSITAGAGNDTINAGNGNNTINAGDGANSVTTGSGLDNITTGTGNDTVNSGDGDDVISTGAGADQVTVGNGNTTVDLGAGNDVFVGGTGNSIITGGVGADVLTGGAGADLFRYVSSLESNGDLVPLNRDTITDFASGVDHIGVLLSALGVAVTGVVFGGNGADFADVQGAVALTAGNGLADYVFQQDNHRLWIDADDNGVLNGLDIQITLTGVTSIADGDVIVTV